MIKLLLILVIFILFGGIFGLASWDIPPPEAIREKVIPNDRFR